MINKATVLAIIPIKNIYDNEILLNILLEYKNKKYSTIQKYFFNLFSIQEIEIPFKTKDIQSYIDNFFLQITNPNIKQLCPFCNTLLFNKEDAKYCFNLKCLDINNHINSTYNKLKILFAEMTEVEFTLIYNKFIEICSMYGKIEFNLNNILSSIIVDYSIGIYDSNFKSVLDKLIINIKQMDLITFFKLCGYPIEFEEYLTELSFTLNNDLVKLLNLITIMKTNNPGISLSYDQNNKIFNEYITMIGIINLDTVDFLISFKNEQKTNIENNFRFFS